MQLYIIEKMAVEPMPFGQLLGEFRRTDFDSIPGLPVLLPSDPSERQSWRATLAKTAERLQRSKRVILDGDKAWDAIGESLVEVVRQIESGGGEATSEIDLRGCVNWDSVLLWFNQANRIAELEALPEEKKTQPINMCRCGSADRKSKRGKENSNG